jgi:hypothetical protein
LIDTKDDGLGEPIGTPHVLGEVSRDGVGTGAEGNDALELAGVVLAVGNLAAETVEAP